MCCGNMYNNTLLQLHNNLSYYDGLKRLLCMDTIHNSTSAMPCIYMPENFGSPTGAEAGKHVHNTSARVGLIVVHACKRILSFHHDV